jgi:hypothetical protein
MSGSFQSNAANGVPCVARAMPIVRGFAAGGENVPFEYPFAIIGVTKDATGAALGNCALVLLRTADNSVAALGTSDGSGNYRLGASPSIQHRLDAYLPGSPDVAGSSVNTLVGA